MSSQMVWYVARSAGMVAWAVASGSVIWGLALSTRALGRRPRPAWLFDLHRFLGAMALIFTGIHVVAILADTYVHFGIVNVLVPFTGSWHPVAVAWGIVGFYALLAVELTSLARIHVPKRVWRRVHLASFVLFAASTVHALTAGTDRGSPPFQLVVLAVCGIVAGLTAVRVVGAIRLREHRRAHPATGGGDVGTSSAPRQRALRAVTADAGSMVSMRSKPREEVTPDDRRHTQMSMR